MSVSSSLLGRASLLGLSSLLCLSLASGCARDEGSSAKAARKAERQAKRKAERKAKDEATPPAVMPEPKSRGPAPEPLPANPEVRRVVLVIADDLGIDTLAAYRDISKVAADERPFPATPNIDAICSEGVRFTAAWATPTCTPTRGSILTGSHGFRTGLDGVGRGKQIAADQLTLARVLHDAIGAETANIGKWHLGESDAIGGLRAPNQLGWGHYAGSISNLEGYDAYTKVVDGREVEVQNYATSETVDDALAWIGARGPEESWLLWLAFNAPHGPFHLPPASLHAHPEASDDATRYDAMIEALDHELGRLRASLPPDVDLIFLGDNGTPAKVVRAPHVRKRGKGTLYQGGVHVPLCIAGARVTAGGRSEAALVSSVDLFATIAELMGVSERPAGAGLDSVSLMPYLRGQTHPTPRDFVYTEQNRQHERNARQQGGRAIRDARYKLIAYEDGSEAFYDLREDPLEGSDLSGSNSTDIVAAKAALVKQLASLKP